MEFQICDKNNKEVPEDTIHLSHGLRRQPPGFLFLSTRGPWPWSEEGRGFDRPNPATRMRGVGDSPDPCAPVDARD